MANRHTAMKASIPGLLLCLLSTMAPPPSRADDQAVAHDAAIVQQSTQPPTPIATNEFAWELDPYYSNLSFCIPLTNTPVPEVTEKNEVAIYGHLLQNILYLALFCLKGRCSPCRF